MVDCHAAAGTLDALVSGKRASPRHAVRLDAQVRAARGEFPARVLDLSLDGALLSIPLGALGGEPGQPLGPAEQFALLEGHFRDSFDLHVPSCGVVMEAQVIRLLVTGEDSGALGLGCRFVVPLSDAQQAKLGILQSQDSELLGWGEASLLHDIRLAARPECPVAALLVDQDEALTGPLFLGPVAALGKRAMIVRLWDVSSETALAALSAPGVRVRVQRGAKTLHASPCAPVSTRYIDSPRPGVEVLLACGDAVPRAVRKLFRRA